MILKTYSPFPQEILMSCVMNCYQSSFPLLQVISLNSFSNAWGINIAYTQQEFEQLLSVRHWVKCWDTRETKSVSQPAEFWRWMSKWTPSCGSTSHGAVRSWEGDWPVAKCTVKDNKCQGDVEKGFEVCGGQNGVCRCEACSMWAGPQVGKSWVCGDGDGQERLGGHSWMRDWSIKGSWAEKTTWRT